MQATNSISPFREALLVVLGMAVTVLLLYGHTLHVPFYLDDFGFIIENDLLRDLPETLRRVFSQRGLTKLSFAFNYRINGWSLPLLHLTNIVLHICCGWLVWLLLRHFSHGRGLPLFGAFLFLVHPLQTQAITYLSQRSTLLATFFLLVAFHCHLRARVALLAGENRRSPGYLRPYLGAVFAGMCALLSKEHTATFPLLLLVYDQLFPLSVPRSRQQAIFDYLPFFVAPAFLGAAILQRLLTSAEMTSQSSVLISLAHNSPLNYLVTQFSVLWVYLRLWFLPYGQMLEHDYPVVGEIVTLQSGVACAAWLVFIWLLWRLRKKSPLLVFGGAWFLLGLLVESSVIPLDPLFEHRLYLPLFGCVLALLEGLRGVSTGRWQPVVAVVVLLSLGFLTWQRNALWADPVAFYEENLQMAPRSERAAMALMLLYKDAGRFEDAERVAKGLLTVNPRFVVASQELAGLLARRGAGAEALAVVETALSLSPSDPELFSAGAKVWMALGESQSAVTYLQRGVTVAPQQAKIHSLLGALYFELGELTLAEAAYRDSLRLNSLTAGNHKNLAKVLYEQGRRIEALDELRIALSLSPGSPDILEGMGYCALALGDLKTAKEAADKLRYSDPMAWRELQAAYGVPVLLSAPLR